MESRLAQQRKPRILPALRALLPILLAISATAADAELRAVLHQQARVGARVVPYSSTKFDTSDALAILDALPGDTNTVRLVYSVATLPASSFGEAGGWNREHLWPNSYGLDDAEPAFSDLHNLRACDSNVNSARGNKFFDLSSAADGSFRSPAHAEAPLCTTDANSWEPPANQRGDIARALFFMAIRYEGDVPGEPDLELVENVALITASNARMGRLSTLLRWNEQDPPDESERARDAATFAIQGNRNPFVAEPGLASRLWLPKATVADSAAGIVFGMEPSDLPVVLEFAPAAVGPWSAQPATDSSATFCRVRLAD
jgi:endonuclease I